MQKKSPHPVSSFLNPVWQKKFFRKQVLTGKIALMACCMLGMQASVAQVCNPCNNIVTNGDFSSAFTGWTVVGPWTGTNTATAYNGSTPMTLSQTVTGLQNVPAAQVGNVVLTFSFSAGNINGSSAPTGNVADMYVELGGTTYLTMTNGSTNTIAFTPSNGATVSISPNPYVLAGNMWVNSTAVTLTIPWPSASSPNAALLNFRFIAADNGDDMGIDNVSILGGAATLPIKLSGFTATKKDEAVMLNWTTATEANNQGFKILRSSNGRLFDTIAYVPSRAGSQGNSTVTLSYSFIDPYPAGGTSYYRILQIDKDGKSEISTTVQILANAGGKGVKLYPDPVLNELHVDGAAAGTQFKIMNLSGKTIAVSASSTIPVSTLAPGIYLLRVEKGNDIKTIKFMKK